MHESASNPKNVMWDPEVVTCPHGEGRVLVTIIDFTEDAHAKVCLENCFKNAPATERLVVLLDGWLEDGFRIF